MDDGQETCRRGLPEQGGEVKVKDIAGCGVTAGEDFIYGKRYLWNIKKPCPHVGHGFFGFMFSYYKNLYCKSQSFMKTALEACMSV